MAAEIWAKVIVLLCILFILLDWVALLFFIAPVAFPDLSAQIFTKLGIGKRKIAGEG